MKHTHLKPVSSSVVIQHGPETIRCFCSFKMGNIKSEASTPSAAHRHSLEKRAGWARRVPKGVTPLQGDEGHESSVVPMEMSESRRAQRRVCWAPRPSDPLPHCKPQHVATLACFSSPPQTSLTPWLLLTCQTGNLNLPLVYREEHSAFCRKALAKLNMY